MSKRARFPLLVPLDVKRVSQAQIRSGLEYGMDYGGRVMDAPNVPMQVRQSLGQQVVINRSQISRYLSKLRNYGMRPDYPTPHVLKLKPQASSMAKGVRPTPAMGRRPGVTADFATVSGQGAMGSPRRFKKALPNPVNRYQPEVY